MYTAQYHPVADEPQVIVTGAYDHSVRLWDAESGKELGKLGKIPHHRSHVNTSCFSNDGTRLVTGDGRGVVNIWRLETGRQPSDPSAWHLARFIDDADLRGKPAGSEPCRAPTIRKTR